MPAAAYRRSHDADAMRMRRLRTGGTTRGDRRRGVYGVSIDDSMTASST